MKTKMNGYPIPPKRMRYVTMVNDTPHLSSIRAREHKSILAEGYTNYSGFAYNLHKFLGQLLTSEKHLASNDYWYEQSQLGAAQFATAFHRTWRGDEVNSDFMSDKLLDDKDVAVVDEALAETMDEDIKALHEHLVASPAGPLRDYELKLFNKYAGDSSTRTGAGYLAQVRNNYLATRDAWRRTKCPDLKRYQRCLSIYDRIWGFEPSWDGSLPMTSLQGYLSRARTTTFGGNPYMRNMGDYVNSEPDDTTYADLYNHLAIGFLYLDFKYKLQFNQDYVALERVQPGGVETYDEALSPSEQAHKANKQRFVQAQSAVISHAYKFLVDAMNIIARSTRPTAFADKFGEQTVSVEMKRIASIGFGRENPSPSDPLLKYNLVGTDYTNFDASQDVAISNDVLYSTWRRVAPAWMCYRIIDPYVIMTYRDARIFVPSVGLIQTTGVKSGMCDTNQCDTHNCMLADLYELCYYSDVHHRMSDAEIINLMGYCMDNGDDRYKLTPCDAADIEVADGDLGYIAQKSKQEVMTVGSPAAELNITYLKTILVLHNNRYLRTDAIGKIILSKMHPEHATAVDHDYSLVVDFFMTAARSAESPYLYLLVDYMYRRLPKFKQLVDGELGWEQLVAGMVREQMEDLALRRGKTWMRRRGMDYDSIIEAMNVKYGYGDEGYRGSAGALSKTGIASLPQVEAIMALAYERKSAGTLGSSFSK